MDATCSICTDAMGEDTTYTLECGHGFHVKCICTWFRTGNAVCPMCRDTTCNLKALNWTDSFARASELRKQSKRRNAPKRLVCLVKDLRAAEEKERNLRREMMDFKQKHKDVFSYWNKFRPKLYTARTLICKKTRMLGTFASPEFPLPNIRHL
jgi:hypothetical protein